ncbi:MAG: hypothetical protein ISQ02_04640 [Pseudomonadales bacterium]|nr:hypothetical protein [Pseudomonadales bacterium]
MLARHCAPWVQGLFALALLGGCAPASEEASEPGAAPMTTESPAPSPTPEQPSELAPEVALAETFIDTFYAFDREAMAALVSDAGDAGNRILWYQGWAEGGNYAVVKRGACELLEPGVVECPITVDDDPVLALKTGFKVTDTFTLTIEDGRIVDIKTRSNDQPIYYEARKWVEANHPELIEGPCAERGTAGGTPGDCARAMTEGYRRFAASPDYTGPNITEDEGT